MLPRRHFFTGVPGSRWSGVAQHIESNLYDTSDRTPERTYSHSKFSGHAGAYFGTGMEFPADLASKNLDAPYTGTGCRLHKSHEWAYMIDEIVQTYPDCWITFVYRDNELSFEWWKQAGGWNITYPNYDFYVDDTGMREHIRRQNDCILEFTHRRNLVWHHVSIHKDVFKTTWKP